MEDLEFLFVTDQEEGTRIDKLLASRFPDHSRTYFQYLIDNGFVRLNGESVKKRVAPEEGDEIEVYFQATPEASLKPEKIPLDILYEDEHLLAINKPAGMVVHPAPGHWSGTFVNALLGYTQDIAPGSDPLRPGIVHRLDKDTSGILIAAKTLIAHQKLIELFATRKMDKQYLAICHGRPSVNLVNAPIGRHPVHRKEMAALPDGREALTEICPLAFHENLSLILAKPRTGRTHQIRVHLKHIGCPIVGDPVYGKGEPPRQLLHAYRLNFIHPITGSPIQLAAPLPDDMKAAIRKLSLSEQICAR
jgi:23S rRNA pseudouridine1911/1915/1917 synthase